MPHIDVSLYPGRTPEIKENIARKIRQVCNDELGFMPEHVSVSLTDTDSATFVEDVNARIDKANIIIESELIKK